MARRLSGCLLRHEREPARDGTRPVPPMGFGRGPALLVDLAIEPGQTERIAFAAEHPGRWLLETMATDWAAPRLVRWYNVE